MSYPFFSPVTFGGSVRVRARVEGSKGNLITNLLAGEIVTGLPCGPIAQWSECSHGLRGILGSSPSAFTSPVTFGGSVWVPAWAASRKGTALLVPAWFRADSRKNLFKQGKIVTGLPCGPTAQCTRMVCEVSWGRVQVWSCAPPM